MLIRIEFHVLGDIQLKVNTFPIGKLSVVELVTPK